MKLLFDLLYIEECKTSGVANFAYRLLDGIKQYHSEFVNSIVLLIDQRDESFIKERFSCYECIASTRFNKIKLPYISSFIESIELKRIIRKYVVDIYYNPFVHANSKVCQCMMIGTIHDIQQLYIRKGTKLLIYRFFLRRKLKRYDKLICISANSLNELILFMPKIQKKCKVIYNSVQIDKLEYFPIINTFRPYILNVNTLLEYKNVLTLIKAFNSIKNKIPHKIVLKARETPYWNNVVMPYIERHDLHDRIFLLDRPLTKGQMATLYKNASLFVTPSTMEGFGYTPIEAMAYGVPTIATKISALYESTIGLASYLEDPYDVKGLAQLILDSLVAKDVTTYEKKSKKILETYSIRRNTEGYLKELGLL